MKPPSLTQVPISQTTLLELGWDSDFSAAFNTLNDRKLIPARVSIEHNHLYRVLTNHGETMAQTAGRLRHLAATKADLPAVGDWVAVSMGASGLKATIKSILPRRSCFSRKTPGDPTTEQVVAANVDLVFIVAGLDQDFNPRRIGRYLVAASESGALPVVVLNKSDLHNNVASCIAEVNTMAPKATVHVTCCQNDVGIDSLNSYLSPGITIALLGASGVGKSSIINCLLGEDRQRTRAVRKSDSRGRHTTIHRELIVRPAGGVIIDTPGMRELSVWDTDRAIEDAFSDFDLLADNCHFRNCTHREEPGCAVRAAVTDGRVPAPRLAHYHRMITERKELTARRAERETLIDRRKNRGPRQITRPRGRRQ